MSEDTLFGTIKTFLFVTLKGFEGKMNNNFASLEYKIDEGNKLLEKRLEEKLSKKILESQEDTIEALTKVIYEGYNMHEERIQRVERKLHLSPIK